MEQLLDMAKKVCDKVELFSVDESTKTVDYLNGKLHDIESKFQSGVSMRVIKDGKLGFAYTKNLLSREDFLQNALNSLQGGVAADFNFSEKSEITQLDTYDAELENLESADMIEECRRVYDKLTEKTKGEALAVSIKQFTTTRVLNSSGIDYTQNDSLYAMVSIDCFPGSGRTGFWRLYQGNKFQKYPDSIIDEMTLLFNGSIQKNISIKGGKMKALFLPNSLVGLIWRLQSGLSAKSIVEQSSPIADKVGQKIFSDKITFCSNPLDDKYTGARAFDDEGVPSQNLTLIEGGILKGFFNDLERAYKLKTTPTGNGYRTSLWGDDDQTALKPMPFIKHVTFQTGKKPLTELIKSINKGIIIESTLGFHSGNIPNGDLSIVASPGMYVENGEIVGRIKNVMVSGNIYDIFRNVVEVGDELYPYFFGGMVPPILFDDINVAVK
jgi:PmbA protein